MAISATKNPRIVDIASAAWRRVPFKGIVLLVIVLSFIREQFPFSHYPMYASMNSYTDYFFVTDFEGVPYAHREVFKTGTSQTKRIFLSRIGKLRKEQGIKNSEVTDADRQKIGQEVLGYLFAQTPPALQGEIARRGMVLEYVVLERSGNGHKKTKKETARLKPEYPLP